LRQAAIAGHGDFGGKLSTVILASPDIDVDVFKAEMRTIGKPKYAIILFASSDDKALAFSSLIAGDRPRVGSYTTDSRDIADLGVIFVDLSASASIDSFNHSKYAVAIPEIARKLRERLSAGDKLETNNMTLTQRAGSFGGTLGGLIGSTAGAVVTLPAYLLTLPGRAASQ